MSNLKIYVKMAIIDNRQSPPVPKYIKDLMARASFQFSQSFAEPGYTIAIGKRTDYTQIQTLKEEIEQLSKWVHKECRRRGMDKAGADSTIIVHSIPHITLYCPQYAFVTIFDPIMQSLEPFIPKKK